MTNEVPPFQEPVPASEPTPPQISDEPSPTAQLPLAPNAEVPGQPAPQPLTERAARVPGWLLPLVAAIALLLGVVGGAIGGVVATRDVAGRAGTTPTLQVPPRTAAPLPADNNSIPAVAAKVLPSTVQIVAEFEGKDNGATGSGWVYDNRGHIVTNNHVIEAAAKDNGPIKIIDNQGNHYSAKVVGRSAVYDLAVLEAPQAKDLTPMAMGLSQDMRVGETVIAVGSPLGLSASVTSGIVSALERPVSTGNGGDSNSYINAVQTDAAINPGNSGGPLVNLQGQVIGVNSAIASMGTGMATDQAGNIGVGFAIPAEQVVTTVAQIIATGKAEFPVIGAGVRGTEGLTGATITNVEAGMPAASAGLKAGDLIKKVNGRPVSSSIDLVVAIRSHVAGDKVTLLVERDGKTMTVQVTLAAKVG